jgi:predicted transcriptional regulator
LTVSTVWHAVEAGVELTPRLVFGSLRELFSAITEKRLELLRHVAGYAGLDIRQLAQALVRDYRKVRTDVSELIELGLPERNDRGGRLRRQLLQLLGRDGLAVDRDVLRPSGRRRRP